MAQYGISGTTDQDCKVAVYNASTYELIKTKDITVGEYNVYIGLSSQEVIVAADPDENSKNPQIYTRVNTVAGSYDEYIANLYAEYDMSKSGTTLYDISGNNRNGTIYGSPTFPAGGLDGAAIYLDGSNDYVRFSDNTMPTNNFTFTGWVKNWEQGMSSRITLYQLGGAGATDSDWFSFYIDSSTRKPAIYTKGFGGYEVGNLNLPNNSTWGFVACTISLNERKLWVNSDSHTFTQSIGTITGGDTGRQYIGTVYDTYYSPKERVSKGYMDSIKIYNRVLTDNEILYLAAQY